MAEALAVSSAIASLVTIVGQVSKLSYGFLSDVRNASKSQKMFLREVSALTEVFLRMEGALDVEQLDLLRPSSGLRTALEDCQGLLLSLRRSLEKATEAESRVARFKSSVRWPFDEKEVKGTVERLRRYRDVMVASMATDTLTVSIATHRKVNSLARDRNHEEITKWLENPDPPRSFTALYESACPGTGHWLLRHTVFSDWRDGSEPFLWCYGHPGVGKTILSSIALHDLHDVIRDERIILHHFCDSSQRRTTKILLQSLLQQVLRQGNSIQTNLLKQYRTEVRDPSIKELTKILSDVVDVSKYIYLVVDALDEFEDRKTLLPILHQLARVGIRVFITSRDIPDIRNALPAATKLHIQSSRADLELYVRSRLAENDEFDSMIDDTGIVSAVIDQADGRFLLARLLMDHLLSCTTVKQVKQALISMPVNLADAYESTFERLLKQSPNKAKLATDVIGWVTHAERHLQIEELRHALAVEEDVDMIDQDNLTMMRTILQVSIGLLCIDVETNTVRMIHHTAYEYFRQQEEHFLDMHVEIAKTCLTYLGYRPNRDGACNGVEELRDRFIIMPFLSYAAQQWGYHARQAQEALSYPILQSVRNDAIRASSFQALQYRDLKDSELATAFFNSLPKQLEPLHVAAYWNLDMIGEAFLHSGQDPNILDEQEWSPLHWACSRGSDEMVEVLLKKGAAVDALDQFQWTPLFWASIKGYDSILRSLLRAKANCLLTDMNGWTVLQWAASKGNGTTIQILLSHYAELRASQKLTKVWVRDVTVNEAKTLGRLQPHESRNTSPLEIAAGKADSDTFDTILQDLANRGINGSFNGLWEQKGWDDPRVSVPWRVMTKSDNFDRKGLKRWQIYKTEGEPDEWKLKLLHGAIRDGKPVVVRLLIELGVDLHRSRQERTPLEHAAMKEDPEMTRILLANGAQLRTETMEGYNTQSALHLAVAHGFDRTVEALIQGDVDINIRNEHEETPLLLACQLSNRKDNDLADQALPLTLVKLLVKNGADIGAVDYRGRSALHLAVKTPNYQIIKYLLANNLDAGVVDESGYTAFQLFCQESGRYHFPADSGDVEILDLLLAHAPPGTENVAGPQQKEEDEGLETPLAMTLRCENWLIFHLLLARKAVFHTTRPLFDMLRRSAWVWAMQPKAVRLLLDFGADPTDSSDAFSQTPLGHTALEGLVDQRSKSESMFEDFKAIFDMYVDHGLDVNAIDSRGENLLHVVAMKALEDHQSELTQYFLDLGVDPYQMTYEPSKVWDAFLLAAIHERHQVLRVLFAHAAKLPKPDHWLRIPSDIDIAQAPNDTLIDVTYTSVSNAKLLESLDKDSFTPLRKAVSLKRSTVVSPLLSHSADFHIVDQSRWTLLHHAAHGNDLDTVRVLLTAGLSPNAQTSLWQNQYNRPSLLYERNAWTGTALHLATMNGNFEMVSLLLEHGADVHADSGARGHRGGHGPKALNIAVDTDVYYGSRVNLSESMLRIAQTLVEHGADVNGVAEHLSRENVCKFEGFEELWEKLRRGIGEGKGQSFMSDS
ncbi:uncharacterized protein KY384_000460 [Bacidia gigantensis]|uniref:uncharacterized protein n=1 Tax=Bacidia gigantensis TaxID=2732470 RepID=UPI001D0466EF|nr:uncharacterized protein KY384_000460 [Bacidia gigantensis]KAG8525700.1 hypothetical protein KY384_000460 [Bacidia gigantensis]